MDCERDRLINYIKSCGIAVNIGKNKARGHKGFFRASDGGYRIDISNSLSDEEICSVLVHEFIHYVHYCHDINMENIEFMLPEQNDILTEELLRITVNSIKKKSISPLYSMKQNADIEVKNIFSLLKKKYPDIKLGKPYKVLENILNKSNMKYLLKHDNVAVYEGFTKKLYRVSDVDNYDINEDAALYIRLKSKQRLQRRINSRISKLNRYYNRPSELLARSFECYIFDNEKFKELAPNLSKIYNETIKLCKIKELSGLFKIFNYNFT